MKRCKMPVRVIYIFCLVVFLLFPGNRVSGQGTTGATPDAQQDPVTAAGQAPTPPTAQPDVIPQHTLTIGRTGNGQGKVTNIPAGALFKKGTPVTLHAVPDSQFGIHGLERNLFGILTDLFGQYDDRQGCHGILFIKNLYDTCPLPGERGHPSFRDDKSDSRGEEEVPGYPASRLSCFRGPGGQGFGGRGKLLHFQQCHRRPRDGSDFRETIGRRDVPFMV